ncbi:hypothetical protein EHP00_2162 [Ecytonucleospora hepatopenaei]|uniref:Uncharacterized protein n=1 Tax=Ecytonucleospora hepatopenaei TaxID=646526 RepID=A0A1W0E5A2_9MICR|nr:hypothetical protein EHP00_2162 [Ecytonucleospora hepatopenaei]
MKDLVECMVEWGMVYVPLRCKKCKRSTIKVYNDATRMDKCFFAHTECDVHIAIKACLWGSDIRMPFIEILRFIQKYTENDDIEWLSLTNEHMNQKTITTLYNKLASKEKEMVKNMKRYYYKNYIENKNNKHNKHNNKYYTERYYDNINNNNTNNYNNDNNDNNCNIDIDIEKINKIERKHEFAKYLTFDEMFMIIWETIAYREYNSTM